VNTILAILILIARYSPFVYAAAMSFRLRCCALALMLCLGSSGCSPTAETQTDEQTNPHFKAGREKLGALDYQGAIDCFERALEDNPRSALAHYELGVLFDQHEIDYAAAIYHYSKALKLRPNGYPADNIRQRIPACRQELIKADSLAVINPAALRETERMREENQALRKQIQVLQARLSGRPPAAGASGPSDPPTASARELLRAIPAASTNDPVLYVTDSSTGGRGCSVSSLEQTRSGTPAAARARTHSVKAGETLASVARLYQIRLSALQAANPGLDPRRMKIGCLLIIPAS